jgi:hypothetical protein
MHHQAGGLPETYQFLRDGDNSLSKLAFVQKALNPQADQRGDKYAGLVQGEREAFFYVAGPVYDDQNRPVGGILVGISLKTLVSHLREQTLARRPSAQSSANCAYLDRASEQQLYPPHPKPGNGLRRNHFPFKSARARTWAAGRILRQTSFH